MKTFEFTPSHLNYRKNNFKKKKIGFFFILRKCSNFPLTFYFSCSHSSNTYVEIKDSKEDRILGIYCRSGETVVSASNEVTVKFINKEPSSKKGMQLYFKMGNISCKTNICTSQTFWYRLRLPYIRVVTTFYCFLSK